MATTVACFAVCMAMICTGCGKDGVLSGGKSGTLSPPSWIQGSWGYNEGGVKVVLFKFTSDDILSAGIVSLKTIWNVSVAGSSVSLKESKKNDSLYEITVTGKSGGEKASAIYSFKKGDGTYIEVAANESGDTLSASDYDRIYKIN